MAVRIIKIPRPGMAPKEFTRMSGKHRRPPSPARRSTVGLVVVLTVGGLTLGVLTAADELTGHPVQQRANADVPANSSSPGANTTAPGTASPTTAAAIAVPLHLIATTPATGATAVDGTAPIRFDFDAPVSLSTALATSALPNTALPAIAPGVVGTWSQPAPASLQFTPAVGFAPDTSVQISIPTGVEAVDGEHLVAPATLIYTVASASLLRLQQLLAELRYLPVDFTADVPEATTLAAETAMLYQPPAGTFTMRFPSTPQALAALWREGAVTPLTTGAIMAFENVHQLKVDGQPGPQLWSALLDDAMVGRADPAPYSWALTTMSRPEAVQIWSDGEFVFSTAANTGIAAAPTPKGSWPVFARYRTQTMRGTNPNGTKYVDPGVPYVSYFYQGDAIHGFPRPTYGRPQSLGCVELPYHAAAQVWDLIDYGTVVTVTS